MLAIRKQSGMTPMGTFIVILLVVAKIAIYLFR